MHKGNVGYFNYHVTKARDFQFQMHDKITALFSQNYHQVTTYGNIKMIFFPP